jgi:HSP20 family protein
MNTTHDPISSSKTSAEDQNTTYYRPYCLAKKEGEKFHLAIALPGVSRENLTVSLEKDLLTVRANRCTAKPQLAKRSRSHSSAKGYRLKARLHPDMDPEAISAQLEDGVLTLVVSERESARMRVVPIN